MSTDHLTEPERTKPSTLGLTEATTSWTAAEGFFRTRVHQEGYSFEDWTADGVPVRQLLQARNVGSLEQLTSYLTEGSEEAVHQIDRLLGRGEDSDFEDGRIALLVCPIDWDLWCGAITTRVVLNDDTVEWRDFGWQNGEPNDFQVADPPLIVIFDRLSYEEVLTQARNRYS